MSRIFLFYIFCKKYRKKPGGGRANAAPLTPLRESHHCGLAGEVILRVPGQISADSRIKRGVDQMKKCITVVLCVVLLCAMALPVSAAHMSISSSQSSVSRGGGFTLTVSLSNDQPHNKKQHGRTQLPGKPHPAKVTAPPFRIEEGGKKRKPCGHINGMENGKKSKRNCN